MKHHQPELLAHDLVILRMREQAITLLSLWGWEPVERIYQNGTVEVRLWHRGEGRCFSTDTWAMWPATHEHYARDWQPCEWARFSTWTLKRCIRMVEERHEP